MAGDTDILSGARIAIVGLGLMGGSLALALRGKCAARLGIEIDPVTATLCGSDKCACDRDGKSPNWCRRKARINGTLVHVTAAFGFALAGLVIQDVNASVNAAAKRA